MQSKKYKIVIKERKLEKKFASLKKRFSFDVWLRMLTFLTTRPKEGKKEMQFRKYDLPEAHRILYVVLEESKDAITRIICAGDHNEYTKYLKKYGKKG